MILEGLIELIFNKMIWFLWLKVSLLEIMKLKEKKLDKIKEIN
jgi:hypothetical protein